jgi:hypothetical protein
MYTGHLGPSIYFHSPHSLFTPLSNSVWWVSLCSLPFPSFPFHPSFKQCLVGFIMQSSRARVHVCVCVCVCVCIAYFCPLHPSVSFPFSFILSTFKLKHSINGEGVWCLKIKTGCTPVILATQEAEIRRIRVRSQLGQIVHGTPSQ